VPLLWNGSRFPNRRRSPEERRLTICSCPIDVVVRQLVRNPCLISAQEPGHHSSGPENAQITRSRAKPTHIRYRTRSAHTGRWSGARDCQFASVVNLRTRSSQRRTPGPPRRSSHGRPRISNGRWDPRRSSRIGTKEQGHSRRGPVGWPSPVREKRLPVSSVGHHHTTSKLAIMPMSSCSSLWQCMR